MLQHKENKKDIVEIIAENKECIVSHAKTSGHIKIQWFLIGAIIIGLFTTA